MQQGKNPINYWLLPFAWLFGIVVGIRNWLYDRHILKSEQFDTPVISIGNLTVGGTGKTPHTEYLIRLLSKEYTVGVLSRGYKRKSKGYVLAAPTSTVEEIGDEPYQIKKKFPAIHLAVDKNRCNGIRQLTSPEVEPPVDVILLDDAYQHRKVTPGINILLVNYHRMITNDRLLPAGRLREPAKGKTRANIIIVTKCPTNIKPVEFRILRNTLSLYPYQSLFFSTFQYKSLYGLFNHKSLPITTIATSDKILLLTGIAFPEEIIRCLKQYTPHITSLTFGDHHAFTQKDIAQINQSYAGLQNSDALVITTEKDATRLVNMDGLNEGVRDHLYILPIEVAFLQGDEKRFNDKISSYVYKNSRNSILAHAKNRKLSRNSHHTGHRTGKISF